MTTAIRQWVQYHRHRAIARQLRTLPSTELRSLGIERSQIDHLAHEVSLVEHTQGHRPIIAIGVVIGLTALWVLSPAL